MELVDDIITVFPDDIDLLSVKNAFLLIKKTNPKLIIKAFDKYVVSKYKTEIINGDIDYFLNKDYSDDLISNNNSNKILESIDRLRNPIRNMKMEDKEKVIKYIQNLQKICDLYLTTTNGI
jgi:hypothetical protein